MSAASPTAMRDRKAEHIRLALEAANQLDVAFFDDWRFDHVALPEIDRAAVDPATAFLGKPLAAPLLISCMTGGTETANRINHNLAAAAERAGVAVGVGSQRKALEGEAGEESFRMREVAPTVPLLANLGAVQLNYGFGVEECLRAVEMIQADALVLHLNPLQEAIQPEGQTDFRGLLPKIAAVARALPVPLIVKEVGSGLTEAVARRLADHGVAIVDTAGLGGTSWARIEAARAGDAALGESFADWGVPTPRSIRECRRVPGLTVIGSGGLRNGVDVAKAVALGADLAGLAFPFLAAATESAERVVERVRAIVAELEITMFCLGVQTLPELRQVPIHERSAR